MLKYLIVLLDDTAVSYCYYSNRYKKRNLISLEDLKKGILFAMKENLMIQFVYPDYEIPEEYRRVVDTIDHGNIVSSKLALDGDIVVFNGWDELTTYTFRKEIAYVLRITKEELFVHFLQIREYLPEITRLNLIITDVESFTEDDFILYEKVLKALSDAVKECMDRDVLPQLNLLTDRIVLGKMNNCSAGWENITLAPDGKFYVCPAFYQCSDGYDIGNLANGLHIKNAQLYKLSFAPICRSCDAYQCKRCIYLNWRTTWEVNTPSHEQCVVAHLERNASRALLLDIGRQKETLFGKAEIKEIAYLDPFEKEKEYEEDNR